jgi:hypothetical protein
MRCIAQYGRFGIQYRPRKASVDINGVETVTQEGIYLQFVQGDLYENELRAAEEQFKFKGQFQHVDEATPALPTYRLSTFDTMAQDWPDELREEVEAWLIQAAREDSSFIVIDSTPIEKPWPAFDEWPGEPSDIVVALETMGYDLQTALDYERLFGKRRPEIIAVLEEALGVETVSA